MTFNHKRGDRNEKENIEDGEKRKPRLRHQDFTHVLKINRHMSGLLWDGMVFPFLSIHCQRAESEQEADDLFMPRPTGRSS